MSRKLFLSAMGSAALLLCVSQANAGFFSSLFGHGCCEPVCCAPVHCYAPVSTCNPCHTCSAPAPSCCSPVPSCHCHGGAIGAPVGAPVDGAPAEEAPAPGTENAPAPGNEAAPEAPKPAEPAA